MSDGVFITGASGFVGGAVLRHLSATGRPIRALARDRTRGEAMTAQGATPVIGDLFEPDVLRSGMDGCDVVYHVAGVNQMCASDPAEMFRVNEDGTRRVVEAAAAAGVRRVVYTSSAATLGEARGAVGTETSPHRGSYLSNYERSKHAGERAAFETGERLGVEVVAVNPCSVQGPGRTRGSARIFLYVLNARVPIVVNTWVSLVDIEDCAAGHLLAERHGLPGGRYVLCGASLPVRDIARVLGEVTGRAIRPIVVPARMAAIAGTPLAAVLGRSSGEGDAVACRESLRTVLHGHRYDATRSRGELGVRYTPIEMTMERTVRWYVDFGFIRRRLPKIPAR